MVDSFIDLKIMSQQEQAVSALIGSVFTQLHLQLVTRGMGDIGTSFPEATKNCIGSIVRVHGRASALRETVDSDRMRRMTDYFEASSINEVPSAHSWCLVSRKQPKITASKARRLVRRGAISESEAEDLYDQSPAVLKYPFLRLDSKSTGQRYRLYVCQTPCSPPTKEPFFNSFGLGDRIPWF